MRVYIAGPMSGIENSNFPAFHAAAAELRALGHEVVNPAELNPDPDSPWAECMRPWTTAYITANGNALPCCISPFATSDYASLKMGNLFERPFDDLWNDERYQLWRKRLLSDHPNTACAGCGVHWSL